MVKKTATIQEEPKKNGLVAKILAFKNYVELSRIELRKVTWPTLKETRTTTIAVLAFVVAMAIFLGIVDLGLSKLVSLLLSI